MWSFNNHGFIMILLIFLRLNPMTINNVKKRHDINDIDMDYTMFDILDT